MLYKEVLKDYKKEFPLKKNNETISTKDKQWNHKRFVKYVPVQSNKL